MKSGSGDGGYSEVFVIIWRQNSVKVLVIVVVIMFPSSDMDKTKARKKERKKETISHDDKVLSVFS